MNELQIRLTADMKDLMSVLNKAQQSLKAFEKQIASDTAKSNQERQRTLGLIEEQIAKSKDLALSLKRATNEQDVAFFNAELEKTNQELARLNSLGKSFGGTAVKSFDNLKRSAGAASGAAISFGRIIQDAPFGIIGVANNIQNFGEQFVALGDKSTTAAGKLKLFFSALITPSNLAILAVSALTAAYQAYSLGLFDATEETKEAVSETERFNQVLNNLEKNLSAVDSARLKANKSAANELAEVELLNSVLTDTSKSENERVIVYNKLLEKYPKIIGNITQEKSLTEGLGEAYNLLIASIQERAKIEAISGAFAKVQEERILLLVKERKEFLTQNELFKQRNDLLNKQAEALAKVNAKETKQADRNQALRDYSDTSAALEKLNQENNNFSNIASKTNSALQENSATLDILKEQYGGLDQALANLSDGEPDKNINRTTESLSLLNNSLTILREQQKNFFGEDTAKFFRSFDPQAIVKPVEGASMIYTENVEAMIQKNKEFEEALNSIGLTSAQVFQAIANGAAEGYSSFNEFITDLATTQQFFNEAFAVLEAGIENTIGDVAFSIGEALGSGGDALRSGGGALLGGMAAILNQLGQLAIQAGITIEATKQSLKTLNGPIAIAAGVAMIALAGYLSSQSKSLAGKFGGGSSSPGSGSTFTNRREFGGPVSKGRAYIVGERRPELFVPNTNGVILPQLPSMDYSSASVSSSMYGVEVMLKGPDDLLFFVEQAQIRRNIR
jgi:hypothetical protein